MPSVEFEGDDFSRKDSRPSVLYARIQSSSVPPGIVRFLLRKHIVKTENQANILLLVAVIVLIIASLVIYKRFSASPTPVSQTAVLRALFPNETF